MEQVSFFGLLVKQHCENNQQIMLTDIFVTGFETLAHFLFLADFLLVRTSRTICIKGGSLKDFSPVFLDTCSYCNYYSYYSQCGINATCHRVLGAAKQTIVL